LIDALASLFPDEASSRMMVGRAGMDETKIAFVSFDGPVFRVTQKTETAIAR
jgi:hypothetical protein